MPYLNWKAREIRKRIDPHQDACSTLSLDLTDEDRVLILPYLEQVFLHAGSEFRLDLPDHWIIFWKFRDSESRLLLAHPQPKEWVTTAALEPEHGRLVIERLKGLKSGDAFSVSELGMVGAVSNVDLIISLVLGH